MRGYSTKQVSDLIGLDPPQIRHYVRSEVLKPNRTLRGHYRFSFQDVVLLRTAKGMIDSDVTVRRTYKALRKLKSELSAARSLSALRIFASGNKVLVREADNLWEVESGQHSMDFSISDLAEEVSDLAYESAGGGKPIEELTSDELYNLGLDLEEIDQNQAKNVYQRAASLDPANVDAIINLGRILQLEGDLKMAKQAYERGLSLNPRHELANYNLGTIFDELDESAIASSYYEKAPNVPDAHYNLARLKELAGDQVSAKRHLQLYKELVELEGF